VLKTGSLAPEIHGLKIEVYIEFEGEIHLDNKHRFLFMEAIRALRATDFYFNFRVDFGISVIDFDILLDHSQTAYFGLCNNYYNTKPNSVQALLHTAVGVYPQHGDRNCGRQHDVAFTSLYKKPRREPSLAANRSKTDWRYSEQKKNGFLDV